MAIGEDGQPDDYPHMTDAERATQNYYDRKLLHREEVIRPLMFLLIGGFIGFTCWLAYIIAKLWVTS